MNLRLLLGGAVSAGVVLAADEFINRATKYEIDKYECTTDDCDDTSGEKDLQLLQTMMVITTDGQKSVYTSGESVHTEYEKTHYSVELTPEGAAQAAYAVPTTTLPATVGNGTAAQVTGVKINAKGDMKAFITACVMNFLMACCMCLFFSIARMRYPEMYSNNLNCIGLLKTKFGETFPLLDAEKPSRFDWITWSLGFDNKAAAECIGLDNALLLRYSSLCMEIMLTIGLPMTLIMGPLHRFFGGKAAGEDYLSYIAMGNVSHFHPWLYYLHGVIVILVSQYICIKLYRAQKDEFMPRRFKWLAEMPLPRSTTVLVEGIPTGYKTDEKLKQFFEDSFQPGAVAEAHVVKYASNLSSLKSSLESAEYHRDLSVKKWEKAGGATAERPVIRSCMGGPAQDAIDFWTQEAARLKTEVDTERQDFIKKAAEDEDLNAASGFVVFNSRRDKELAQNIRFSEDTGEWLVSVAPDHTDIRWCDLKHDEGFNAANMLLGYAIVAAVYILFVPICVFITNIATTIKLGPLQPFWAAFAPTAGLLLFLSFLPTVLINVFYFCFPLKAEAYAQHQLQIWYFWFMVIFVILVTAVGSSLFSFAQKISKQPFLIFNVLADTLPTATHFYMNFLVLQCFVHSMNFTRYIPLAKYIFFKGSWEKEDARAMAEPEDQDYYGIGSRSARFAINMLIGIIFGTLSPLVSLLAWCNFAVCRLAYGYLIVYAETKKPDLGGVFWVTKLKHTHIGVIIYCVLMTGVLTMRAPTWVPGVCAIIALVGAILRFRHFNNSFDWEILPFKTVTTMIKAADASKAKPIDTFLYIQPELRESK